jgi:hypothetical protein
MLNARGKPHKNPGIRKARETLGFLNSPYFPFPVNIMKYNSILTVIKQNISNCKLVNVYGNLKLFKLNLFKIKSEVDAQK